MTRATLVVLVLLLAFLLTLAPAFASPPATVVVDPARSLGAVNKMVFGNNQIDYLSAGFTPDPLYSDRGSGLWDPDNARPVPEYVALSKQAGLTVARWPGGCGAHEYNWKTTVGPVADRPHQRFGLGEFLVWCEASGSIPLITVADYWGNEKDAADLVEYLNAPAAPEGGALSLSKGRNPNGGTDWAAVRAAQGHPAPWNVVWFEWGNESDHGDHPGHNGRLDGKEYGRRYLLYRAAMRAVDPHIKLGCQVQNTDTWSRDAITLCGRSMDFAITHTYVPGGGEEVAALTPRQIAEACLSADLQIRHDYQDILAMIKTVCGRTDVPLAVTEYNGGFVQEKPVPYRQSFAVALRNADHLRVLLDPANHVLMANFWQFANEYWGMVQGYVHAGATPVKQANFLVFQLYHDHFGDDLLPSAVTCARWDTDGYCGVRQRRGAGQEAHVFPENLYTGEPWTFAEVPEVTQSLDGGGKVLAATFNGGKFNYYQARIHLPAAPDTWYRVTGHIRTDALEAVRGVGFQIGDDRGWVATHSCITPGDVHGTSGWTEVIGDYRTLPDTKGIDILARRILADDTCTGRAWFRIDSVQRFQPFLFAAVPYVEAIASRRHSDGRLCVMLVHKDLDADTPLTVSLKSGRIRTARAWALTGPSPDATNLGPEHPIGISDLPVEVTAGSARLTLPRLSAVSLELTP